MPHATGSRIVPRRTVLTGMAALGLGGLVRHAGAAETGSAQKILLADRLATYADTLRYDDLDAATVERVKSHLIDTIGCGIASFDERVVANASAPRLQIGRAHV